MKIVGQNAIKNASGFGNRRPYQSCPIICRERRLRRIASGFSYVKEILAKENSSASHKVENLNHIDLHFSFPSYTEGGKALSKNFLQEWRSMILENPYSSDDDWIMRLDSEKKQMIISVHEVEEIIDKFKLKSFEGGYKVLVMTKIEKMNDQAANKFLKFLEEPPEKTIILLLAESIDFVLPTILSRCQLVNIPKLPPADLENALTEQFSISEDKRQSSGFSGTGRLESRYEINV
jgi:DNA polymerase-3 subunit delta'